MKRPKDGITNSKLTPYEILQDAILQQAVADIKTTPWYKTSNVMKCSYGEGRGAVEYVMLVLRYHGYTKKEIANIFRKITPHNYKYEIVKEELNKRGIEL